MTLELDTRQRAMLQEMGVHVWLPPLATPDALTAARAQAPQRPLAPAAPVVPARPAMHAPETPIAAPPVQGPAPGSIATDWPTLSATVHSCRACGLCVGRQRSTLLAPPLASPCDWMVVGDPPDADEDRAGAPFAGTDGLLLDQMLRALRLQRANPLQVNAPAPTESQYRAYITQVVKCRPAHGAIAQASELMRCSDYLRQEIALVRPRVIVAMGRFANQVLLAETPALALQPLGKLRGSVHRYAGIPVVVSYPPKLLMRNSADKAKAWADLCLAAALLE